MAAQNQKLERGSVGKNNANLKAQADNQHIHQETALAPQKRPLPDDTRSENEKTIKRARYDSARNGEFQNVSDQQLSESRHKEDQPLRTDPAVEAQVTQVRLLPNHSLSSRDMTSEVSRKSLPSMTGFLDVQSIPSEVQHLLSKYDITPMSILSSSKMQQKIRGVLERIGKNNLADPNVKPGVVMLHAKADVASKMIGIVEIAKKEVEFEKCKWWQYSKLEGRLIDLRTERRNRSRGRNLISGLSASLGQDNDEGALCDEIVLGSDHAVQVGSNITSCVEEGDEETADAFETMPTPTGKKNVESTRREDDPKKKRNTPVMTIYLARVPVPGLKELYGYVDGQVPYQSNLTNMLCREQTNA